MPLTAVAIATSFSSSTSSSLPRLPSSTRASARCAWGTCGEEYEAVFVHRPKPAPGDGHPVDHYKDHPSYDPSKTIHLCRTCGSYASLNSDGSPDWAKHDEIWGSTPEQRGE